MTRYVPRCRRWPRCGRWKPLTAEFWGRNRAARNGWQSRCKLCATAAVIASRKAHPDVTRRNDAAATVRREQRQREQIRNLRTDSTCADCGQNPGPEHMQFDHVPERGEKVCEIGELSWKWTGWGKLKAELAKCDLVCDQCHVHRTMQRLGKVFTRLSPADRERRYAASTPAASGSAASPGSTGSASPAFTASSGLK